LQEHSDCKKERKKRKKKKSCGAKDDDPFIIEQPIFLSCTTDTVQGSWLKRKTVFY
jgi:hypothetical protein